MRSTLAGVLTASLLLAGCAGGGRAETPQPTVAASEAFPEVQRDVAALPGVLDADLTYTDDVTRGYGISGTVTLAEGVDAVQVLDDVYATLWTFQGFEPALIRVVAEVDGVQVATAQDLGSPTDGLAQVPLRERYGPWPGAGPTARA